MDYLMQNAMGAEGLALYIALFVGGLIGSATHCTAMCGPFILAQTSPTGPVLSRAQGWGLFAYHLGRMTTYMALGFVAGMIGESLAMMPAAKWIGATFLVVAAVLFALNAMPALSSAILFKNKGGPSAFTRSLARLSAPIKNSHSHMHRYLMGVTLGFLPCGMIYAALMVSASAGHAFTGALAMGVFVLGTIPALTAVGAGYGAMTRVWPQGFKYLTQAIMLANAVILIGMAKSMVI